MNLRSMYRRHNRTLLPLVALLSLFAVALVLAQTPDRKPAGVITIDGAQAPDRIPDWILWREVFKTATLADQSGTKGDELWLTRLHLSRAQAEHLVQLAQASRDWESTRFREMKALRASAKETKESRRIKLKQAQMSREVDVLQMRDELRARIGEDAYMKLLSYARINIAPTIKVGNVISP